MAENENSERDTHFLNAAEQLYEALAHNVVFSQHRRLSEIEIFKQEQHKIIAQFAYDLVYQTLEFARHSPDARTMQLSSTEVWMKFIPDLTEWPNTSQPPL